MEEWKDGSARFDKSLRKTEEKLKEQTTIGREVSPAHFHTCWRFLGSEFLVSFVNFLLILDDVGRSDFKSTCLSPTRIASHPNGVLFLVKLFLIDLRQSSHVSFDYQ